MLGGVILGVGAAASAQSLEVDRLATPGTLEVGVRRVEIPSTGLETWREARAELGLGDAVILQAELSVQLSALEGLSDWLAWERAALAASVAEGALSAWDAGLWLDALAVGGDERALRRGVVWAWVAYRGGSAAMLPVDCMPTVGEALSVATRAERAASRRNAAALEAAPLLPRDGAALAALAAEGGGALAASLSFVATAWPNLGTPDHIPVPGCDPAPVAAAARWAEHPREDWPRVETGIYAAFETGPVPANLLRRAAIHWYLDTRPTPIRLIAALAEQQDAHPHEVRALTALAAGAAGDAAAMSDALAGIEWQNDPYLVWVRAEGARQAHQSRDAVDFATRAIDSDPFFVAAYLTRASALIALDNGDQALSDLGFLQRAFGDDPAYRAWIDAMNLALR